MADARLVDVLDATDKFKVELAGLFLGQSGVSHDVVEELAAVAVLHNHVEFLFGLDDFVQLNDIGVADLLENFDLASDALNVFLVVDLVLLENFDGDLFASEGVLTELDLAESSFSEMFAQNVMADGHCRVRIAFLIFVRILAIFVCDGSAVADGAILRTISASRLRLPTGI